MTELSTLLSLVSIVFELMHPFSNLSTGTVSTRSERTNYTIDFLSNPRPFKDQRASIASYFFHLEGPVKSRLIKWHMTPVSQLALTFNWSLQKMFPLKKVGIEELGPSYIYQGLPSEYVQNIMLLCA